MSTSTSVRILASKLGAIHDDRTVDAYSILIKNNETIFNAKSCILTLILQHHLTVISTTLIIENSSNSDDEDISNITIIYSLVQRGSIRRTSISGLSVLPLSTNFNIPQPYITKSYTLEPPLTPIVTHISKQAQIKTLSSTYTTTTTNSISKSSSSSSLTSQLIASPRIQNINFIYII